jgi:hypothetical protein
MKNSIVRYAKVDTTKIVCEDFTEANNAKLAISKVWYQESAGTSPHTFFIQTSNLKVYEVKNDSKNEYISFILDDSNVGDEMDKLFVQKVKDSGLIKKYGLKNVIFKSIIGGADSDNSVNLLRLKTEKAKFYTNNKVAKSFSEVKHLIKSGSVLKLIFEVDKIVIDTSKNIIFPNLILSQAQIKLTPQKIELSEYSFVEDELEEEEQKNNTKKININDTFLNTQTEYMEDESENTDEYDKYSEDSDSENHKDLEGFDNAESEDDKNSSESEDDKKLSESEDDKKLSESESEDEIDLENFVKKIASLKKRV